MDNLQTNSPFICFNIHNFLNPDKSGCFGETELKKILSDFSNPKNQDVELFLKNSSVEFTKKNQSVTYLIFSAKDMYLAGYFSIAIKPVTVSVKGMSNSVKRKLERLNRLDKKTESYTIAAFLIAQLGRNFSNEVRFPITGKMLMDFAVDTLHQIQRQIGGLMIYLECEDKEPLLKFYQEQNGFRLFGERLTESANGEKNHKLLQLLSFL